MKRHEITRQIEEWISEMEAYTNDKRVGRTISHSLVALKVRVFLVHEFLLITCNTICLCFEYEFVS